VLFTTSLSLAAGERRADTAARPAIGVLVRPSVEERVPATDTWRRLFPVLGSGDVPDETVDEEKSIGSARTNKVLGSSLLVSGVFLCSWGITSWQISDYQCCPADNTDNVIKIVVGVVLLNAGLVYLLGGAD
jgi:hypothetical protein